MLNNQTMKKNISTKLLVIILLGLSIVSCKQEDDPNSDTSNQDGQTERLYYMDFNLDDTLHEYGYYENLPSKLLWGTGNSRNSYPTSGPYDPFSYVATVSEHPSSYILDLLDGTELKTVEIEFACILSNLEDEPNAFKNLLSTGTIDFLEDETYSVDTDPVKIMVHYEDHVAEKEYSSKNGPQGENSFARISSVTLLDPIIDDYGQSFNRMVVEGEVSATLYTKDSEVKELENLTFKVVLRNYAAF